MNTQGGEANRSGSFIEDLILRIFKEYGIPIRPWREVGKNGDMFEPCCVITDPPYQSLFDRYRKSRVQDPQARTGLIYRRLDPVLDIRIIPRWQENAGSADEKLIGLFYNAWQAMVETEIWIIAGGDGFKPHALAWLQDQCAKVTRKGDKKLIFMGDVPTVRKSIRELVQSSPRSLKAAE